MGTHTETGLDPSNWDEFRGQAHRILDGILDYVQNIRERPVWQAAPERVRDRFRGELPAKASDLATVYEEFARYILPYSVGNVHPVFFGWIHGAGTPVGIVAEMLAAGLNANLGGRNHIPIHVERQVTEWMRKLFGFPEGASGLFVTGASMANLIGILVARDSALGFGVRRDGIASGKRLAAYASEAVHACVARALDIAGLGTGSLRAIRVDSRYRIEIEALREAIDTDRRNGFTPSLVVGTAGTVDTGAVDDLDALAEVARREVLWFHVDGACGALAMLVPSLADRL